MGGSGRKLFISTSFGGVGVPLPFEAVEPEIWSGLGPQDSGEVLVDILGLSTVEYVSNATRGLERRLDSRTGLFWYGRLKEHRGSVTGASTEFELDLFGKCSSEGVKDG